MARKISAFILVFMFLFTCTASLAKGLTVGGWIVLEDNDPDDIEDRAEAALKKAVRGLTGAKYDDAEVLAYQIVSGTNYCILCRITPVVVNPVSHWALVYVHEALDGTCEIIEVQDVEIGFQKTAE